MQKQQPTYENFLFDVPLDQRQAVDALSALLTENGCTVKVELAKSGYVVSFHHPGSNRVIVNYIFRKKGLLVRVYGDNVGEYQELLSTFPEAIQKDIVKAPICRRLHDPNKCNGRCPMGNVFTLQGEEHKKCRYSNFMIRLDDESGPFVRELVLHELRARCA